MYDWRKMTPEERKKILAERKQAGRPWHSPPHLKGDSNFYFISAACYEHKHIIGKSPERMETFCEKMLAAFNELGTQVFAWCVLSNHYHTLSKIEQFDGFSKKLGEFHGGTSFDWNGEDNSRGRQVWHTSMDRSIRNERHFWVTMNYIHHNPVHHRYVKQWQDWPFSSAASFLEKTGRREAMLIWDEYPLLDYGKGWDDPEM